MVIEIKGIGISGKKATGTACIYQNNTKHYPKMCEVLPEVEKKHFEEVISQAKLQIEDIINEAKKECSDWEIFESHKLLLEDKEVNLYIYDLLNQGYDLLSALLRTKSDLKLQFQSMETEIMRTKASDIEDIFERMIKIYSGDLKKKKYPEKPFVLVCDELLPSMLYQIPEKRLKGIVCRFGSSCSHGAILAKNRNVPVIINLKNRIDLIKQNTKIAMSGETGVIYILSD